MTGSDSLKEVGEALDVSESDVVEMKRTTSRQRLLRVVKLGLPVFSFILGLWVGRTVITEPSTSSAYPFLGAAGIQTVPKANRQVTWAATIILSAVLYIFGLLFYKFLMQDDSFGMVTLYGPHARHPGQ